MSLEKGNSENILDMLNAPDKRACFLLGVLTRKLTYIQYQEINSTPFIKKLWDLNLSYEKIQKLYKMVIGKLTEYDSLHYYTNIEEEITLNLLESEDNWNLNKDEISYYFVLGFTIGGKFNLKNEEDDVNE